MRNSNSETEQRGRFAYDGLLVFGNLKEICGVTDGNLSRRAILPCAAGFLLGT
jgi:hypothetical protein